MHIRKRIAAVVSLMNFLITFLSIVMLVTALGLGSYTLSKRVIMDKVSYELTKEPLDRPAAYRLLLFNSNSTSPIESRSLSWDHPKDWSHPTSSCLYQTNRENL